MANTYGEAGVTYGATGQTYGGWGASSSTVPGDSGGAPINLGIRRDIEGPPAILALRFAASVGEGVASSTISARRTIAVSTRTRFAVVEHDAARTQTRCTTRTGTASAAATERCSRPWQNDDDEVVLLLASRMA